LTRRQQIPLHGLYQIYYCTVKPNLTCILTL